MSRNRNSTGFALVAVAVCLLALSISTKPPGSHLTDAVASKARLVEDSARDPDRHPAEVLAFLGLEPGMQVADLMGGPGYYAAIMGHAVGSEGKVYLQNNQFALERFWKAAYDEHFANGGLPNVVPWERELDALGFQDAELDAAFMILFYHDTYWLEVDRAKMNAQILRALKPGGVFGVIDHFAEDGSGERDVKRHPRDTAFCSLAPATACRSRPRRQQVVASWAPDRCLNARHAV